MRPLHDTASSVGTGSRAGRLGGVTLAGLLLGACSVVGLRGGTPQPPYRVLDRIGAGADAIEVRRYGDRLAAESDEAGTEIDARNSGFRRLAGFIFGGNQGGTRIAMTAPVAQASAGAPANAASGAPSGAPAGVESDAPVSSTPAADGRWTIRFFLPGTLRRSDVPVPRDASIRIVQLPPATVAVLRFAGTPGPLAVSAHTRALLDGLGATRWHAVGPPVAWFYDPPWTIPALRRNEVAVPVAPRS